MATLLELLYLLIMMGSAVVGNKATTIETGDDQIEGAACVWCLVGVCARVRALRTMDHPQCSNARSRDPVHKYSEYRP